ncbi:MAG: D-2-hydroxyacid dehydrogenase [Bacteroidota bacterium]
MKITITDALTLNPGDLSWQNVEKYGELDIYERTAPEIQLYIERCANAEVIIINKSGLVLGEELFSQLPHLKLIMVSATGYNIIDVVAARKRNITVTNVPGYGTDSVAQHTISLLLELANRVGANAQSVAKGEWVTAPDWCYTVKPIIELANKTIGIIGFGNIGQKVATIVKALGMNVLYTGSRGYHLNSDKNSAISQFVDLEYLIESSDFISLHCPANDKTMKMINSGFLNKMKKTAFLINTSRGQLIDEQDLANALNSGTIAGAALDVLSQEPPKADNPLLMAQNCLITPHNAWISFEARQRIMHILEENLKAYLNGSPINLVN